MGLRLSAVKDTVEATVDEVGTSINKGGAAILDVGLSESKYIKDVVDTLSLL